MKKFIRNIYIWYLMSRNSFLAVVNQRVSFAIFFFGKVFRFTLFFSFLYFLVRSTGGIADYNTNQVMFVFLTFNLVDVLSQFFFRETYRFRPMIVNGGFDLVLVKPVNPLIRSLMGGADIIDLVTIPPLVAVLIHFGRQLDPSAINVVAYLILIANSLLITAAIHIAALCLAIKTTEIDHSLMIFRDLLALGRLPIDIFKQPLKTILTYLLPVGVIITVPARALMGILSPLVAITSLILGIIFIFASFRLWNYSLKEYTSASS